MRHYAGARAHERSALDDGAKRRLIAAYVSDERPTTAALARRFNRSEAKVSQVLEEAGIARTTGRRW